MHDRPLSSTRGRVVFRIYVGGLSRTVTPKCREIRQIELESDEHKDNDEERLADSFDRRKGPATIFQMCHRTKSVAARNESD